PLLLLFFYCSLPPPAPPPFPTRRSSDLALPGDADATRGCFVTLHQKSGELRGCIGTFERQPLWQAVRNMAVAAALNDPRFPPLRSEEHTSELQSRSDLVCRLLLEKKKKK